MFSNIGFTTAPPRGTTPGPETPPQRRKHIAIQYGEEFYAWVRAAWANAHLPHARPARS